MPSSDLSTRRIKLFGIEIDALAMQEAVRRIEGWLRGAARDCPFVVTPNVDHIVKLSQSPAFIEAYHAAALVLADGKPVILASHLLGAPLPGTVPGSDIVPALFDHVASSWQQPLTVFLLGAAPGVAEQAKQKIESQWRGVYVTGLYSPPFGFEHDPAENAKIIALITNANPDLLLIGLGAPKQELWVHCHQKQLPVKAALCIGATIDFLAGNKARAPLWMRRFGLEWLHRMGTEPKRLVKRYLHDAVVFPGLLLKEWLTRNNN